jgi:signal transduction histidine kinase
MLHSNAQAVTEILENLLSNAVKYSPYGAKVIVASSVQNSFASVSVQDEGPGISDDDRERLFQRFARLSAKPTGGEHSTGLGLYIVKRLTEMLGGTVVCNSEPGKGAEFTVSLPL